MNTPEDDLKVGQWIAVSHDLLAQDDEPSYSPFGFATSRRRESSVDGRPLQILAISLPFIAVTDGEQRFPIDVRESKVIRLSPQYVAKMKRSAVRQLRYDAPSGKSFVLAEPPKIIESKPERTCPLCGERLCERYREGDRLWFLACRTCGFEGGMPGAH